MVAYVLAEVEVSDPEGYKEYTVLVPPTIARYGGRCPRRGGGGRPRSVGMGPGREPRPSPPPSPPGVPRVTRPAGPSANSTARAMVTAGIPNSSLMMPGTTP